MRTILKMIPAIAAFFAIAWFVSFQFNPYKWCDDHPDPAKSKDYFICEPFGFEVEKGSWLERSPDHRFAGEEKTMYFKKERNDKHHGSSAPVKAYNCQDANVLMTKDGYDHCMAKPNESK